MATTFYNGHCHCGAWRFNLKAPEISSALSCNCSLCHKEGFLWIPLPPSEPAAVLEVTMGDDSCLTEYSSLILTYKFCKTCGSGLVGEHTAGPLKGQKLLNARAINSTNPFALEVRESNGLETEEPAYEPPVFSGREPDAEGEGFKRYTGSCHCGLIRIALKSKLLAEVEIKEDNCSICTRNSWIGTYPRQAQVSIEGKEHETEYLLFGRGFTGSPFCRACGVHVYTNLHGPPPEVVATWPAARQAVVRDKLDIRPLNLRALDGVEWDRISVRRSDEGAEGYVLDD